MPASERPELSNLDYYLYLQPKYIGIRAIYLPDSRKFEFYGSLPSDFDENQFKAILDALRPVEDRVLDGILVKVTHGHKYYVFDSVDSKEWDNQKCSEEYEVRLRKARIAVQSEVHNYSLVIDTPSDIVEYPYQIKSLYATYLLKNFPGIILRSPVMLYKWGQSSLKSGEMLKLEPDRNGTNN
jgi:hypothetical protein